MTNNIFSQLAAKQTEYQSIQHQIGSQKSTSSKSESYTEAKSESYVDYVTDVETITTKDADGKDVVKTIFVQRPVVKERTIFEQKQRQIKENQEYNNLFETENKAFYALGDIKKLEAEISFIQRSTSNLNSLGNQNQQSLSLVA